MSYALVDDAFQRHLADPEERKRWLLLEEHPEFKGHWYVDSFNDEFRYDLDEVLGPYRAVGPANLERFRVRAEEEGYKLAFFEDPVSVLDQYADLNTPPPFSLNSSLPNTTNGLLPYQVQGFNYLKDLDGGVTRWDTGTGKTVLASALVKYHQPYFDICFFVVKKNNKVNTVRKLKATAGVDAILVNGTPARRRRAYQAAVGEDGQVLIMNYEQFQQDFVKFKKVKSPTGWRTIPYELTDIARQLFVDQDVMCIWDEMPMKLKSRTTRRYMAINYCLYDTAAPQVDWEKKRPNTLRQYMLSATPIENDPEDWFNCIRILDPRIYGTVREFRNEYVASYSYFDPHTPESWHRIDRMALKAAHIVHQVDKDDPDIAAVFPKAIEESVYIDLDDNTAKLYGRLQELADKLHGDEESEGLHMLSLINLFQMICDAPTMVLDSAAHREAYESAVEAWEETDGDWGTEPTPKGSEAALTFLRELQAEISNDKHAKLEVLHGLLTEVHPEEKICLFTVWNEAIMPTLEAQLREWGVEYVRYHGTDKQKQAAQDAFQSDPEVRVFLSSDMGSDSIDLDAGSVVIHYNLPWKWTTYVQRQNRVHRATSQHPTVWYYTLMMAGSVEDRKLEVVLMKRGYHDSLFSPIAGISSSARITKEDFRYILTGEGC